MKKILLSFLLTATACFLLSLPLAGQEPLYRPRLTNDKNQSHHDFPMGVLSATGRLADGERAILVKDVGAEGAAAAGGLAVGDRILMMDGQQPSPFSMKTDAGLTGPQEALGQALERACASKPYQLILTVQRKEKILPLKITVPASDSFAVRFPGECPKSQRYLAAIADHLVATQRADGSWRPGVGGDADVLKAEVVREGPPARGHQHHVDVHGGLLAALGRLEL